MVEVEVEEEEMEMEVEEEGQMRTDLIAVIVTRTLAVRTHTDVLQVPLQDLLIDPLKVPRHHQVQALILLHPL